MSNFHLKRLLAVMQGDFCNITAAAARVDNNPGARNLKLLPSRAISRATWKCFVSFILLMSRKMNSRWIRFFVENPKNIEFKISQFFWSWIPKSRVQDEFYSGSQWQGMGCRMSMWQTDNGNCILAMHFKQLQHKIRKHLFRWKSLHILEFK